MTESLLEIIRQASTPLVPRPTGMEARLTTFANIEAVLFDIYGTLLISASGDIGSSEPELRGKAFADSMSAMGWKFHGEGSQGALAFRAAIDEHHASARANGTIYPEIDITEVWKQTCESLASQSLLTELPLDPDFERLAVEFETRLNPVWPMPNLTHCLESLNGKGKVMGIISNAQFFTPLIFPAICGRDLDQFGFAPNLRYYSYRHLCAKPGTRLYEMASADLSQAGISPGQVLYVGNDIRNDIWPAAQVGFRTVLFAGDQRSLRLRDEDHESSTYHTPDAVVTDLAQIPTLIQYHD